MGQLGTTSASGTWTHDGNAPDEHGFSLLVSCASGVSVVRLPLRESLVVGRRADADVVIQDRSVSQRHAMLRLKDSMTIEDLGSRNGTRVQGVPSRRGERVSVAVGTVLELGDATLLLERPRSELRPSAVAAGGTHGATVSPGAGHAPDLVLGETMKRLYSLLDVIAPTLLPVLIMGETGVGKEVFAAAVHARSTRRDRSMLTLNCAALPESILEGELFGYEKGSFTGATQARKGLFEAANGGSVFLDEIGELPLVAQAKLLRVLENGEVLRLGARQPTKVDVRFIAATNHDVRELVAGGTFRHDLFFRLNGITVTLPPLRDRKADIRPLATALLENAARKLGRRSPALGEDAAKALEAYPWPGNIRELRMTMERAAAFCSGGKLTREHLGQAAGVAASALHGNGRSSRPLRAEGASFRDTVRDLERQRIVEALEACGGNQSRASEMLGIPRRTFVKRLDAYGIGRPRKPSSPNGQ